jgi:hypothetical protein
MLKYNHQLATILGGIIMGKVSFNVKEAILRLENVLKNVSGKEAEEIKEQLESFKNLDREGVKEIFLSDDEE